MAQWRCVPLLSGRQRGPRACYCVLKLVVYLEVVELKKKVVVALAGTSRRFDFTLGTCYDAPLADIIAQSNRAAHPPHARMPLTHKLGTGFWRGVDPVPEDHHYYFP